MQSLASRAEAEHEGAAAQMTAMRARVQGEAWRVTLAATAGQLGAARSSALSAFLAAAGQPPERGLLRQAMPAHTLQKLNELQWNCKSTAVEHGGTLTPRPLMHIPHNPLLLGAPG